MKTLFILLSLPFISSFHSSNSDEVLSKMFEKYQGKWMKSFSFTQKTESYRNDSLVKVSTWHENIIYPDKFRIDFGDKSDGNAAIFTPDSVYRFRGGVLKNTYSNDDDLTFILGGIYFHSLDSAKIIFGKLGYDLSKFSENDSVYIIGANNADEKSNQLWVDKKKLVVVRFINYAHGEKEEGIFSNHKQFGDSWSETYCVFYINDKLIQKETYYDCKADADINPGIFDPHHFINLP